ncbi:MAG: hypothetical protein M3539_00850 [Acidobacteriota bacterium]|nr:hypothetical protein [Acidobacteriota bacterium]
MSFFVHPEHRTFRRIGLAALLLSFGVWDQVQGQSGRRVSKPQPATSPVAAPVATPDIQPTNGLSHQVRLLVARQPTRRHLQSEDIIFASFINRLKEYKNVAATSIGDQKQARAVQLARGETGQFVVLLSFAIDSFQGGTIILNSPDLQLEYVVFAPRTGKKLTKGKVYFQAIGGGRMRKSEWPGGTPIKITPQAAGIEAADHVHDWLRLNEMRKLQPQK